MAGGAAHPFGRGVRMLFQKIVRAEVAILLFSSLVTLSQNPPINPPPINFPADTSRLPFITGQVVISDGTKLSESVQVQIVCSGRVRAELYSDTWGNFDFDPAKVGSISGPQAAGVLSVAPSVSYGSEWDDCSARAVLSGFSSESVEFGRHLRELGIVDIGRVRLHPVNAGATTSMSVSSLLAPRSARKAMEKGLKLEEQRKWPEAERAFRQAVAVYPQYAAAWSELGRMQYVQQNFSGARESFEKSVGIDPHYVRPYLGLMQLAMDARNWPELVQTSDKVLALDSTSYPAVWLLNATAHYNLHNYDAAETSVHKGKRADAEHRIKEFQVLWMQIVSARNVGGTPAGQSPRVLFGINKRVWGDSDPSNVWLR